MTSTSTPVLGSVHEVLGVLAVFAVVTGLSACEGASDEAPATTSVAKARQAVIGGRTSGSTENATVYLESVIGDAGDRLRCSGTLIAPNIVITARHCLIVDRIDLFCNSDGELSDPTKRGTDLRNVPPRDVHVRYGANESEFVTAVGSQIFTPVELTVCKNDVGLVVLDRPLAESYVPLRIDTIQLGDEFRLTGWGYTADGQTALPEQRRSLDGITVTEVGPGLIAAGTFAIPGDTGCHGDSGAGAWFGDAIGGTYSRIEGSGCEIVQGRNVFMMLAPQKLLIERAFEAAGQHPWYAGQPAPWASQAGAACSTNDGCISGRCNQGVCATTPDADAGSEVESSSGAAPADNQGGCVVSRHHGSSDAGALVVVVGILVYVHRRRCAWRWKPLPQGHLDQSTDRVL